MPYAIIDGIKIFYRFINKSSKKPVLIFSHGWTLNWTSFKGIIDELSREGFPILVHDFRGHGKSGDSKNDSNIHLTRLSQDLMAIISLLKIKRRKKILIGHSMGGFVSIILASQHPEMFSRIILIDSSYEPPDKSGILKIMANKHVFEKMYNYIKTHKTRLKKRDLIDEDLFKTYNKKNFLKFYVDRFMGTSIGDNLLLIEDIYRINLKEKLRSIQVPTLVIGSLSDWFFSMKAERRLADNIKKSIILRLPGSHNIIMKKPERISKEIKEFICMDEEFFQ